MRHVDADLSYHRGESKKQYDPWRDPICRRALASYDRRRLNSDLPSGNGRRPVSALARQARQHATGPADKTAPVPLSTEIISATKQIELPYHDPSRSVVYEPPWPKVRPGSAPPTRRLQKSASLGDVTRASASTTAHNMPRSQRPARHAQFLADHSYSSYGHVTWGEWDVQRPRSIRAPTRKPKPEDTFRNVCRVLPYGWLSRTEVEREAAQEGLAPAEAVASLLVGRETMLQMRSGRVLLFEQVVCATRHLDFREWCPELKGEAVDRFLAAFSLLFTPNVVEFVDVNTAGLVEAPGMLRCLPGLLHLDISGNRGLMNLSPLRTCSHLRTANFSGCSSLSDIAVVGQLERLEGVDFSNCSAIVDATLLAIGGQPPRGYECCAGPELMGHPALQWLSFSCCQRLHKGLDAIALCQKLEFVDLWGCDAAVSNVAHCVAIWRNAYAPMTHREVVWPHRSVVDEVSSLEGWSESEYHTAFTEAQHSVEEKLLRAFHLPHGAGSIGADSRKKAKLQSAVDASHEFDVQSAALIEAENCLSEMNYQEPAPPARRKRPAHLAPESFCRGLKALGIHSETLNGAQLTDIFRLLDIDNDGHVEWDEFLRVDKQTATWHELGVLFNKLLAHFGSESEIISGLSKTFTKPEDFTTVQLSTYFVTATVNQDLADRAANTLIAAVNGSLEGLVAALDSCKTLALLSQIQSFHGFLSSGFKSFEHAFRLLDKNKSGSVSLLEFQEGLDEGGALAWRPAQKDDKIATSIFDILDQDKSGVVGIKEFQWLQDFSGLKTFKSLSDMAYAAEKHCNAVPKGFRKEGTTKVPFRDFLEMWKVIGKDAYLSARTCFCLLDANVSGSLCMREWLAFKAFPKMKVSQDASILGEKLRSHFAGGLEEAFSFIYDSDNAPAPPPVPSQQPVA
eukprot:gnl/MRDRNA2_/MRDRNA2_104533_c0_seq1.p1 gnl/MRDRNA2_/MRDRNA2_104533_c0~~gnl/MRDRNA2_/MRDRNA2_104533_c0_seq1.p1  ORF type:complete len:908 (+),score=140.61 gnl/MRDRNA2_/MRDRNA2_104533_c0_seq1:103-2826(+)